MRFFAIATLLVSNLVQLTQAACSTNCVNTSKSQIDAQCGATNPQICQCQNYPNILQCFNACTDPASRAEMSNVQGWVSNVCTAANQVASQNGQYLNNGMPFNNGQFVPIGGPTPTLNNGLFSATTIGNELIISASGTSVMIPFSGTPTNTNVPVIGSLYSSYNLGSISVGYKTSSMPGYATRPNSATLSRPTILSGLVVVGSSVVLMLL